MDYEAKDTRVEQVGDATVLCEQQLKDQRARVQAAAKAAEFPPGSLAGGSLTEQRNMMRARLQECWRLKRKAPTATNSRRLKKSSDPIATRNRRKA